MTVTRLIQSRLSRVSFLERDQTNVTKSIPTVIDPKIASNNDWLWRVIWSKGVGYGCVYQPFHKIASKKDPLYSTDQPWGIHLVKTTDGVNYELVTSFKHEGTPGEATPLFLDDGTMTLIFRNGRITNLERARRLSRNGNGGSLNSHWEVPI